MNILVVNGANLNLLGERERSVYGKRTLADINAEIERRFEKTRFRFFQSNCEGEIINCIHKNRKWADWLVINPGAYTHYSYAIRDAITASGLRAVEVHVSDIMRRESFRKKSVIKDVCAGRFCGKGALSYIEAVKFCVSHGNSDASAG